VTGHLGYFMAVLRAWEAFSRLVARLAVTFTAVSGLIVLKTGILPSGPQIFSASRAHSGYSEVERLRPSLKNQRVRAPLFTNCSPSRRETRGIERIRTQRWRMSNNVIHKELAYAPEQSGTVTASWATRVARDPAPPA